MGTVGAIGILAIVAVIALLVVIVGTIGALIGAGIVYAINMVAGTNVPIVYGAIAGALLALMTGHSE